MTSLWYLESKTCLTVCDTILAFLFTFYECVFLLIYIIVNTHIPAHNSHSYLGSTKQHIIWYAVQYGYLNYLRKCIVHLFFKNYNSILVHFKAIHTHLLQLDVVYWRGLGAKLCQHTENFKSRLHDVIKWIKVVST